MGECGAGGAVIPVVRCLAFPRDVPVGTVDGVGTRSCRESKTIITVVVLVVDEDAFIHKSGRVSRFLFHISLIVLWCRPFRVIFSAIYARRIRSAVLWIPSPRSWWPVPAVQQRYS